MKTLVNYFINRPVVTNAIMFGLILSSLLIWPKIGKEEMPEFSMNWLHLSIRYPGAPAEDVELFITKPIEEKLKGLTGIDEITATSAYSSSTFRIAFDPNIIDLTERIQEVKDAVDTVDLPSEVKDPVYRQFKSSEKAIIDIGVYLKDVEILDVESRIKLQQYALAIKNKLMSLPEISGVDTTGYLRPELQIKINPKLLEKNEISLNQVKAQVVSQHVRHPIGNIKDKQESEISIVSELKDIPSLNDVTISAGFQGQKLKLSQIATIENGFEESTTIHKIQGREGIIFDIKKSSNTDIITAQKAIVRFLKEYKIDDSPIGVVLIDDESYDVSNRLSLIGYNGLIGFSLIIILLFLFLDFKSGIWVAMGIPFALAFTLICAMMLGYTVNNMTLASIIIVLGIVVDDAIIIAENISRKSKNGNNETRVNAVIEVGMPVIASMLTTCAAFIPLYFFSGRFGMFVKYIPVLIFLMLFASLIESFFILPSHMAHSFRFGKFFNNIKWVNRFSITREHFIAKIEASYAVLLEKILHHPFISILSFVLLLSASSYLFSQKFKYVMFPREEARDFRLKVTAPEETTRYQMARMVKQVEDIFLNDNRGIVTSVQTSIGQNRRGGEVKENEASVRVEIVPPSERDISLSRLLKDWEIETNKLLDQFTEIKYQKMRFGSDSGSPIAIEIQENNDEARGILVEELKAKLEEMHILTNIEIERPVSKHEYVLNIKKDEASRLGLSYNQIATTLRAYIEGDILYTLIHGDEEVDVRFTSNNHSKDDINELLKLTVANNNNYLVPINSVVEVVSHKKPANIQRVNFKRTTQIFADISKDSNQTPLEIAEYVEQNIFPGLLQGRPTSFLQFRGEVEHSRESQSDFSTAMILVLAIIYIILIFLFDSFFSPFLIGLIIPFGIVGTIFAFGVHGMNQYGFFAVVGTLGMIGVVINDSIVLINKLNVELFERINLPRQIAQISSTRLRAIVITTLTTVAGLFPTAYGIGGYDSMLTEMMLAMGWGLLFGMFITLVLMPSLYSIYARIKFGKAEQTT